jgi:hypothetical protein
MSYREENGIVTVTMSRDDYAAVMFALGMAAGESLREGRDVKPFINLLNRLNEGNPKFVPWELAEIIPAPHCKSSEHNH